MSYKLDLYGMAVEAYGRRVTPPTTSAGASGNPDTRAAIRTMELSWQSS